MSENRWTEEDFVQLARPKMIAAADASALPHLLFEFFSQALLHYDGATSDGKAYIDKAMGGLVAVFEASRQNGVESAAEGELESVREALKGLFLGWRDKHDAILRIQEQKEIP